ncbi:hypothetical protein SLS55_004430 [Diplodia seriata]|uniref:C2H2-type domain-containing protein n=1 Tax=Diplodia seriata TaxID=420778 RepID=A0ABR3CJC7_9PEZI
MLANSTWSASTLHGPSAVSNESTPGSETKPHICMQCQKPKAFKRKGDFDNHVKVLHGSVERLDRINMEELVGLLQKSLEQSQNSYRSLEKLSKEVQALHGVVDKCEYALESPDEILDAGF